MSSSIMSLCHARFIFSSFFNTVMYVCHVCDNIAGKILLNKQYNSLTTFEQKKKIPKRISGKVIAVFSLKGRKINEHIFELILSCAWHMHSFVVQQFIVSYNVSE